MSGRSPRWISIAPMIGTLRVGSVVKLNLNSTPWDWLVVHQGLPSSMYDESCNGTWLLLKDIYEKRAWNSSNVNDYANSTIHSYLNSTFLAMFDSNIQEVVKQVKIPYRKNGGSGGTDQSGANGLSTKVFLLSGYEVGWTTSDNQYFPVDGAKLGYFVASTAGASKRIAYLNGSVTSWWLRSPNTSYIDRVRCVKTAGDYGSFGTSISYGIRPAIILPSNFRISADLIMAV